MSNQLLFDDNLPDFSAIEVKDIAEAVDYRISEYKKSVQSVKSVADEDLSFSNTISILDEADAALNTTWSLISHLNAVMNTDEWQEKYNEYEEVITTFCTELGQDKELFRIYKKLRDSKNFKSFSKAQQRTIDLALLDFKLSGVDLTEKKREELKSLFSKSAKLETNFSLNVLKATQAWHLHIPDSDRESLAGLPESNLEKAKEIAVAKGLDGYVITLDMPSYHGVMTYCQNRDIRRKVYEAYVTRCSSLSDNRDYDNAPLIEQIMQCREKIASILEYDNYAEYAVAKNMAKNATEVVDFLQGLLERGKERAKSQMLSLCKFAKEQDNISDFSPWDYAYYSEKHKENLYSYSDQEVKEYFQEDKVWDGLFSLVKKLFDYDIIEEQDALWHDDAKLFVIYDKDKNIIGRLYSDLYAREGKRSGAWMSDLLTRYNKKDSGEQIPCAFIVCNFSGPTQSTPSLLSHDELTTLFHEFGHAIHHLFSKVKVYSVSGGHGVAWDAIELPSQFMENWCWEWDVIKDMAVHYKSGAPMSKDLFDRLLMSKKHNAALALCRQLEFALFDENLHIKQLSKESDIRELMDNIRESINVFPVSDFNRFQNTFSHIFAGGYSANYYSYLWAEMLSTDAYAMFKESGLFDNKVSKLYLQNILEAGGQEEMEVLYKKFRGREPQNDSLLAEYDICDNQP